ncbi:MAG TPA: penicillin-binding protein 1A [Gammaproteobacteria bacterium]|jgi:penicillin-binding protein 1A|nr:penicillin-binding protein 1A [Gammaproteobacteria bacterium]
MNSLFKLIRYFIILCFVLCAILIGGAVFYIEHELPDIDALNTVQLQVPLQVFTEDNKLIATFGEKRRIPVPYDQIPEPLIQAVLATEDQRYFQHAGVDLPGLGRAAVQLLLTGKKSQGGSTITMQVARSFYLSRQKTFGRKIREILLAIKIEHRLKKEKILELYLNKVFLGNRAYGVAAAAEIYYGKRLNELSIDQYAMLAGLPKAPSTLNPLANAQAAMKRRNHVLGRMYEQGYINRATYDKALQAPLAASYHDLQTEVKAPYAAELVREQLEQMYGDSIYTDGFKVYTTIHSDLQSDANIAVRDNTLAYDQRHGYRGAATNLGVPSINNTQHFEEELAKIPNRNGLEPAAVMEITERTISVLHANGDLSIIPWTGLSWARTQINADYLGPRPRKASQIVKLGDLVYINHTAAGYQLAQLPKVEAGLVALSPNNGAILAMVGGFDYQTSKFNRMTHAQRQPGSSFKPFIYSAALDKGYTLATIINDAPLVIENAADNSLWRPMNDTKKFYGPTRLRTAIIESRNLVSIRLLAMMGMPYTIEYLKRFGFIPGQLPPGLSLALGTATVTPLQMAQAYAIFANTGYRVVPFIINTITTSQGDVIYQARPLVACGENCDKNTASAPRVLSPQNAFLMTSALKDVIQRGTASLAKNLGREDLAGKTGTTQNQVDAWFAGYNPDIVAISWMGFDQPQSLHEYGAQAALPLWMQFIESALKDKPSHLLPQPPGIVSQRIDATTGKKTSASDSNSLFEYFMEPYTPDKETNTETGTLPEDLPATDTTELSANTSTSTSEKSDMTALFTKDMPNSDSDLPPE